MSKEIAIVSRLIVLLCVGLYQAYAVEETVNEGFNIKGLVEEVDIEGEKTKVLMYRGIPYAKAPEGNLRFAKPEKIKEHNGVLEATKFGKACMQPPPSEFEKNNKATKPFINIDEQSEDCLFLNIWQPETDEKDLAVMIWLHGGGFTRGSTAIAAYDAAYLAAKEKVVVVSIQYRLGIFGFLQLPEEGSTDEKIANGNQGLFDILMAVEWVRDNIGHFNGDDKKLTLFGESSGAAAASILWMSPLSKGLFKRVILQSGTVFSRWAFSDPSEAKERADKILEITKCGEGSRADQITCLQGKSEVELLMGMHQLLVNNGIKRCGEFVKTDMAKLDPTAQDHCALYYDIPFKPVIDGKLLSKDPVELLKEKQPEETELIIGANKNEGIGFLIFGMTNEFKDVLNKDGTISDELKFDPEVNWQTISSGKLLDKKFFVKGFGEAIATTYGLPGHSSSPNNYGDPNDDKMEGEDIIKILDAYVGDMDFICPMIKFAELAAQIENTRVYVYYFDHGISGRRLPFWTGAMHGTEIDYVFARPFDEKYQQEYYTFGYSEKNISDHMTKRWAGFAKSGKPNYGSDTLWRPYLPSNQPSITNTQNYLYISSRDKVLRKLRDIPCQFWQAIDRSLEHTKTQEATVE